MKIREGFVSNSSSSSFIICLPQRPADAEELHGWLFPNDPTGSITYFNDPIPKTQISAQVFKDLESALSLDEIAEEFASGTISNRNFPRFPQNTWNLPEEERQKIWTKYENDTKMAARVFAGKFFCNKGHFFKVSYSDNDGSFFSTMEHGGIFENIVHQQISHH